MPPVRIAVVDLLAQDGGGLAITKSLFEYAAAGNAPQHEWLFIVAGQDLEETEYVKVIRFKKAVKGYFQRAKTELIDVNRALRQNGIDCVVCMSHMRIMGCTLPQFVYLHQALPFQKVKNFSFLKKNERKYAFRQHIHGSIIKKSIAKAKAVFVQTEWMKNAVSESVRNVQVVKIGYPAGEGGFGPESPLVLSKDFFYPCRPAFYKNIPVLIKAVAALRNCGYSFRFYITLTEDELKTLGEAPSVDRDAFVCLGRCPPESVRKIYRKTALVFPSYVESLGLPLLEAREAGTWIIASDSPFSHEILDDYPNRDYFGPFDAGQLTEKMKNVLDGKIELKRPQPSSQNRDACWERMVECIQYSVCAAFGGRERPDD